MDDALTMATRAQARAVAARLGIALPPRPSKFGNRRVAWNGWVFDSIAERDYAQKLERGRELGTILAWVHHPIFPLSDGAGADAVRMELDFLVVWSPARAGMLGEPQVWAVDVKGPEPTEAWKVRARLFRTRYPHLPLYVVRRGELSKWEG